MANELIIKDEDLTLVKTLQSVINTSYDDRVLVKSIADSIALPKNSGYPVNMSDVLQIVRVAVSMHLDPMLGGIWGFKDKNGRLVCGVTKKGWQQAIYSQPDYAGIEFRNSGELHNKKLTINGHTYEFSYYDSCTCIIKKQRPDGSIVSFEGTAYFDEEFMANKEPWLQRPKRMLEGRAMTICASMAYGWGAYDNDELSALKEQSVRQATEMEKPIDVEVVDAPVQIPLESTADKAKALIHKDKKDTVIGALEKAQNKEELTAIWRKIPKSLQQDSEVKAKAKAVAEHFTGEEI